MEIMSLACTDNSVADPYYVDTDPDSDPAYKTYGTGT